MNGNKTQVKQPNNLVGTIPLTLQTINKTTNTNYNPTL